MKNLIYVLALFLLSGCKEKTSEPIAQSTKPNNPEWISLFNGEDLEGWTPKIRGERSGKDTLRTFVAENGMISVSYANYDNFNNKFGHLFYKEPFEAYFLSLEYRFKGDQIADGEGWAYRNSGVMFHSQSAASMLEDQKFPVSLEAQFLGGNGVDERQTMNLCTPGTHVTMTDGLITSHCVNSTSDTYHGDDWVKAGLLVLKDSLIVHYVNGKEVMRYSKPQLGGGMAEDADEAYKQEGKPLTKGYIALQSESHSIDFRNIYLTNLESVYEDQNTLNALIKELPQGPVTK